MEENNFAFPIKTFVALFLFDWVLCSGSTPQYQSIPPSPVKDCPVGPVIELISGKVSNLQELLIVENSEGQKKTNKHAGGQLSFRCNSTQPIFWTYDGLGVPNVTDVKLSIVQTPGVHNSSMSQFCYSASIIIKAEDKNQELTNGAITGKYTCSGYQGSPNRAKPSFFIYEKETEHDSLVQFPSISYVIYDRSEDLVIPCHANSPNVNATLFRMEKESTLVPIDPSVFRVDRYNPQTGFRLHILNMSVPKDKILGKYVCATSGKTYVNFAVVDAEEEAWPQRSRKIVISKSENSTNSKCAIFTCTFGSIPVTNLEIAFLPCKNEFHCEFVARRIKMGLEVAAESTKSDHACGSVENMSYKGGMIIAKNSHSGIVACRTTDKKFYNHKVFVPPESIPTRWKTGGWTVGKFEYNTEEFIHPENSPDYFVVRVRNETFYVNDDEVKLSCLLSKFFFPGDPRWMLVGDRNMTEDLGYIKRDERGDFAYFTAPQISGVVCSALQWGVHGYGWVNVTHNVTVQGGTAPDISNFSGEPVEKERGKNSSSRVVLYESDSKEIFCTFGGRPQPDVKWTKNGQKILKSKIKMSPRGGDVWTHTLCLPSEWIGVYECIANNSAGQFTHVIHVTGFKPPTGHSPTSIILGCTAAILLGLLILAMALGMVKFRRSAKSEEPKPSLSESERGIALENLVLTGVEPRREKMDRNRRDESWLGGQTKIYDLEVDFQAEIGKGEFSKVYKAKRVKYNDPDNPELVAVKFILEKYKYLYDHEVSVLEKILADPHENIVNLYGLHRLPLKDKAKHSNLMEYGIVTEFCKYKDLGDCLKYYQDLFCEGQAPRRGSGDSEVPGGASKPYDDFKVYPDLILTRRDLADWVVQIAKGMAHLASIEVHHGDLSLRNILLHESKKIKINDFGLSNKTAESQFTPKPKFWMAPEIVESAGPATEKSDVWAFAVTIWELVTGGKYPYSSDLTDEKTEKEYLEYLKSNKRLEKPDLATEDLYRIMSSCWHWDPSERPTFSDLVPNLQELKKKNNLIMIDSEVPKSGKSSSETNEVKIYSKLSTVSRILGTR